MERAADSGIPVTIEAGGDGEEAASGLAHMLQQFIEQTLEVSPGKRSRARRLRGEVLFRAAEDEAVCVSLVFAGDRIALRDGAASRAGEVSSVTADFISIAHLTSGQESPFALLARRRLRARVRPRDLPFLLRMLGFMRLERDGETGRRRLWLTITAVAAAVAAGAALYAYAAA